VRLPSGFMTTLPCNAVAAVTVSGSPSGSLSLPSTAIVTGLSSVVVALSFVAVGAGLVTVRLKLCVAVAPAPSRAVTVTP
jgi:hypothetical protein